MGDGVEGVKHPAIIQIRGTDDRYALKMLKDEWEYVVAENKHGVDIYFSDVNSARNFISRLRKNRKFKIKMSTKYAGLRKGRVRVLFVYSLRFDDLNENRKG